jgi:hypothetical protein
MVGSGFIVPPSSSLKSLLETESLSHCTKSQKPATDGRPQQMVSSGLTVVTIVV